MTYFSRRDFLAVSGAAAAAAAPPAPYRDAARTFLGTMIEKGTDRHGRRPSPVFCLALDPETYAPPRAPAKIDWEYARSFEYLYRDFGYYWKSHLHGSNLIYDQGTIRALNALSDASGDPRYRRAADAYLGFFLENMVSPQTGIFGWGEHIFYNVFLDYIIGGTFTVRAARNFMYGHELERWTTMYDVLWAKDPEKTRAEIDAIYEYKILEPDTFINNRHSDFYSGRRTGDTLTFVKHSGLFVHAFALAHVNTGERKYLDWARKMADLFWNYRDPRTNLVRGCIQRKDEPVAPAELAQLAFFLLRAYQWHPEAQFADRALAYLKAYRKYFRADEQAHYREQVDTAGNDRKPGEFATFWEGPVRMAKAAVLAYSLTGDREMLELAADILPRITPETTFPTIIQRSLISDEVEARACVLSGVLDLYEVTGEDAHLAQARALADDAIRRFLDRGLFLSTMQLYPEGDKSVRVRVYDGRSGAGWLALNLLRLQRDADATAAGKFRKFDKLERIYD